MSTSTDFTDNLATLDRTARLFRIQQEARSQGAEITLEQAAHVLHIYEAWEREVADAEDPRVIIPIRRDMGRRHSETPAAMARAVTQGTRELQERRHAAAVEGP